MNTPTLAETYRSFSYLRSVCRSFEERLALGEAIRRGWPARAIEDLAKDKKRRRGPSREMRHRMAIQDASRRRYVSPEEVRAAHAEYLKVQAAIEARDAMKATKADRPKIPSPDYAPLRAACRSMLDVDRLQAVLDAGWKADDVKYLARQFSETAVHVPHKETPGSYRFALGLIAGWPAGQYYSWFPRPTQHE